MEDITLLDQLRQAQAAYHQPKGLSTYGTTSELVGEPSSLSGVVNISEPNFLDLLENAKYADLTASLQQARREQDYLNEGLIERELKRRLTER